MRNQDVLHGETSERRMGEFLWLFVQGVYLALELTFIPFQD